MVKQNKIEFICTANHGRSPVAALIANNYLREIGADGEYSARSSGSHVDVINSGEVSADAILNIIDIAQGRGMFSDHTSGELLSHFRALYNDGELEALNTLKNFYQQASDIFKVEEHQYRDEILPLLGIEGELKQTQDQTVARSDTLAVFAMANSNLQVADGVYGAPGYTPKVMEALGISNPFGLSEKAYQGSIEELVVEVPRKIDNLHLV